MFTRSFNLFQTASVRRTVSMGRQVHVFPKGPLRKVDSIPVPFVVTLPAYRVAGTKEDNKLLSYASREERQRRYDECSDRYLLNLAIIVLGPVILFGIGCTLVAVFVAVLVVLVIREIKNLLS